MEVVSDQIQISSRGAGNRYKIAWVIFGIVLVVFILVMGYAFIQSRKQFQKDDLNIETPNDWFVYKNTVPAFEIKHPNDWMFVSCNDSSVKTALILNPKNMPECEDASFEPIIVSSFTTTRSEAEYVEGMKVDHQVTVEEGRLGETVYYKYLLVPDGVGGTYKEFRIPLQSGVVVITVNDLKYEKLAELMLSTFRPLTGNQ